ncbi:MAG: hypothetical protein QXJ39_03985, partial [Candidatus Korarchaeum sp.]
GTPEGTYSMGIELYKGEMLLKSRSVVIIVKSVEKAQISISIVPNEVSLTRESPRAQVAVLIGSTGEVGDITLSLVGLPSGISYSIPPKLRLGQLGVVNLTLGEAREGNYTASLIATTDGVSATGSFRVLVKQVTTTTQATQTETTLTVRETVTETLTVTPARGPGLSEYLMIALILLLLMVIAALLLTRRGTTATGAGASPPT